jgi:hypothetical protein
MKKLTTTIIACGILAGSLLCANAVPVMRLSGDGGLNWTNVVDNGPLDGNPTPGFVTYGGPVGNWIVAIATGIGQPADGTAITPVMDVSATEFTFGAANLIVQMSDTSFVPFPNETFVASLTTTTSGTITYNTYRDTGNVLFGSTSSYAGDPVGVSPSPTAALLISQGPFTGGTFLASNSVVVPVGGSTPYSLTLETIITNSAAGQSSLDAFFYALPPPNCGGKIGDFVWNDLNANGCQDANEPGIPGVKVDLYIGCPADKSGAPFKTTTTDADGKYLFEGLCAGDYTVAFTTPNGFIHTVALQGCGGTPGDAHNPTDSNCECTGADNCDVCVHLLTDNSTDLTIDCGYIGMQPCLTFVKTPDTNSALAGSVMGYTYALTNCGGTTFNNLAIVDDAGTPGFPGDDFTVQSGITLLPGQGASYHVNVTLPVVECASNTTPPITAGTLIATVLPNGNIKVVFRQSRNLNDNVYGTPAPADGWSHHNFSDLTGSDKAEFLFTDGTGKVVLDFFIDYISQAKSSDTPLGTLNYPSGYGSLGPNGGDGSIVLGAKSNILWWSSTLTENLNSGLNGGFPSPYTVNSPTPESSFPNWDYVDGFSVIVSSNAFGAAGFGGVTIPQVHNSPAKTGDNKVFPLPCGGCITNIATVVVTDNNGQVLSTQATDDAVVCTDNPAPPTTSCILIKGAFKIDKSTIQIPIKNGGNASIVLSEVDLAWKQATNGKITKMSLNGDFLTGGSIASPAAITSGFVADANKRTIAKGQTKTLVITFEHPASKVLSDYAGTIQFGTGCSVKIP